MAISDQTLDSLRSLGRQAERRGRHAVIEPDLLLALLDEIPAREKYSRAIAASIVHGAKLQRIRLQLRRLPKWRRAGLRLLAPQVEEELSTIAPYGQ